MDELASPRGLRLRAPRSLVTGLWLLVLVAVWAVAVRVLKISEFILPSPGSVLEWIATRPGYFLTATLSTLRLTLVGFGVGIAVAIPVGFALAKIRWLERALYPLIVFLQTMPLITIVPVLVIWLGYGLTTTSILVAFSVFFPVSVNTILGVRSIPHNLFFVTRTMGAGPIQTFQYIDWPMALPYLMSGFRISLAVAIVVAVVSEFIASNDGLGYVALRGVRNRDTVQIVAAVLIAAALGVIINSAAQYIEQMILKKYRE
ncbi:ABC transporter permease [Mesorhizobium tamadayense]|uniref:ABC transporter permease n=1 Tax=Mesorhizobium tamadayense TaxID=425306 RepID=A0A3P3F671_9HYPH|nr:ABC transporter permease [Mesorhizobium tamadayense]